MKFGMLHFFEQPAGAKRERQILKEQLDCMRLAEDMGFDSIWAPEHHSSEYGFCASPMVTLAAVASVTKRIRLGSGVLVPSASTNFLRTTVMPYATEDTTPMSARSVLCAWSIVPSRQNRLGRISVVRSYGTIETLRTS